MSPQHGDTQVFDFPEKMDCFAALEMTSLD
jgi:hypothetical protein